jgi:DHA1 family bicyclomycin/chloramphenicol resistance-like MFS transporter
MTETMSPPVRMSETRTLLICALLAAVGPMSMSLYTPAMPQIAQDFATGEITIRLSVSIYFAGFAAAQLICGPLSDGFGRRPVLVWFTGIYLLAGLAALMAPNVAVLVGARFLQGVGAAAGIAISRAIVRDLYEGQRAARMLAMISTVLAIGPAAAPFIGGVLIGWLSWHAVFVLMLAMGLTTLLATVFALRETVPPTGHVPVGQLFSAYRTLLGSPYFVSVSLVVAGTQGSIYTLATILSFILINRVGLSPEQFGLAMLMQTGSFIVGSFLVRHLLGRSAGRTLMPVGLVLCGSACLALIVLCLSYPPSVWTVMGPVAVFSFGIAFTLPTVTAASLTPFPHIAGAASAMLGFLQMGAGLVGGLIASTFADPVVAMIVVIPGMTLVGALSWCVWRRLPVPVAAQRTTVAPDLVLPS